MMFYVSLANAQAPLPAEVTVWTDRQVYAPGEKGTLYIAYYNNHDRALTIKNITITYYNWRAYIGGKWIGNETYIVTVPMSKGQTLLLNDEMDEDITFTVPDDGRAVDCYIEVKIGTDEFEYRYGNSNIDVQDPTPKQMEQIVTLFTILVVLLIVCTIIIAATIFLSARRPRITWKAEEKVEQA